MDADAINHFKQIHLEISESTESTGHLHLSRKKKRKINI